MFLIKKYNVPVIIVGILVAMYIGNEFLINIVPPEISEINLGF